MGFLGTRAPATSDASILVLYAVTGFVILGLVFVLRGQRRLHHYTNLLTTTGVLIFLVTYMVGRLVTGAIDTAQAAPWYRPLVIVHSITAVTTIGLALLNTTIGLTGHAKDTGGRPTWRLPAAVYRRHRLVGYSFIGTWFVTLATGTLVYHALFVA